MVWNIVSPRREGRIIFLTGRGRCSEKWKKLPEDVRSVPSRAALREYDKRICEKPKFNESTTFEKPA
jgi:hypothetical protein